jgi:hypothetical protein
MSTQILIGKLNKEVSELKDDLREMKEFLFAPLNDPEGEYKDSFVKKILLRARNGGMVYKFLDATSFLSHVRSKKRSKIR